jgi:hypothetical protein
VRRAQIAALESVHAIEGALVDVARAAGDGHREEGCECERRGARSKHLGSHPISWRGGSRLSLARRDRP